MKKKDSVVSVTLRSDLREASVPIRAKKKDAGRLKDEISSRKVKKRNFEIKSETLVAKSTKR